MCWVIAVLGVIILACLGAGIYMAGFVAMPKRCTLEQMKESEGSRGHGLDFESLPKEHYTVRSFDGYELAAWYIPAQKPSDRYVIISHGYTVNHYCSLKYMSMFRSFGFHCVIYDDRGHGENQRTGPCTLGLIESKDLMAVIADTYARYGENIHLGLHGESMGAGLTIMSLEYRPRVEFIINDCGYADLLKLLKYKGKKDFHAPGWMVALASGMCRILYGYSFGQVRPVDRLKDNTIPICFIHGEEDDFILYEHSEQMHEATKGYSELHLFPHAAHAGSYDSDPHRYHRVVKEFLERCEQTEDGAAAGKIIL